MNRKNVFKNLIISFGGQLIIIALGFLLPRIILTNYGSDTNGLMVTITQIFTYLALFEAGIGVATKNSLFNPIISDDKQKISEIVTVSRKQFGKVSLYYGIGVILLSIILPFILKTSLSYWTVCLIILFEGVANAISFYFVNTRSAFLTANGKNYAITSMDLVVRILSYGIKILLAFFKVNLILLQACFFAVSLLKILFYHLYTKKKYPWLDFNSKTNLSKLPDKNAYIVSEIAWTIFSSTDMIVLSVFISTSLSSVYSVYSMVFVSLSNLLNSAYLSINYILGQKYHEDIETYKSVHNIFNSFFMMIITIFISTAYILIIPFVKMYTADVTDINYIYTSLPILFGLVQMLSWSRYLPGNLSGLAGYAKPTSIVSIIEASLNIILSIILVNFLGIFGVLLATVIALPIKVIYLNVLSEHTILKRKPIKTILIIGVNFLIFALSVLLNLLFKISDMIPNKISSFILYGVIIFLACSAIGLILNLLVNKKMFKLFSYLKSSKPENVMNKETKHS